MRVQKNRIITAEAAGDAARLQTAQIRLHMLDGEYNRFSRAAGLRRMDERIEVVGFGKYQKSQSDHSRSAKAQFYSPATRSGEYVQFKINKTRDALNTREISEYPGVYVTDKVSLKPRAIHSINTRTEQAMRKWGIPLERKPKIVIVAVGEFEGYGKYDAVNNVVYYREEISTRKTLKQLQSKLPQDADKLDIGHTEYHEMWHLWQAEHFRSQGWIFTDSTFGEYLEALCEERKTHLDELGITKYNVGSITKYAKDNYYAGRFDETEAEFMAVHRGRYK